MELDSCTPSNDLSLNESNNNTFNTDVAEKNNNSRYSLNKSYGKEINNIKPTNSKNKINSNITSKSMLLSSISSSLSNINNYTSSVLLGKKRNNYNINSNIQKNTNNSNNTSNTVSNKPFSYNKPNIMGTEMIIESNFLPNLNSSNISNNICTVNKDDNTSLYNIETKVIESLKEIDYLIKNNLHDQLEFLFYSDPKSRVGICPKCESVVVLGDYSLRCYKTNDLNCDSFEKPCFYISESYKYFNDDFTLDNFLDLYRSEMKEHPSCSGNIVILDFENENANYIKDDAGYDNEYKAKNTCDKIVICEDCLFT